MSERRTLVDRDGRTHVFPPPLEHAYRVEDGRVVTRSLESHVVDHCNLTCAECCSLSPLLPKRLTSPQQLERDLAAARRVLAPRVFKLVGGEPLLHPELEALVTVAKRAAIAPTLSLTTNGLRLAAMSDATWAGLDALLVSLYPEPRLSAETIALAEDKAARFGVRLSFKQQDQFVKMSLDEPRDEALTQQVWDRCWLRERCHLVRDGVFYTCTRPVHFQSLHGEGSASDDDGLRLHEAGPEDVLRYLAREAPLRACESCAGGDAPMIPHRLLRGPELTALRRPARSPSRAAP